jgi:zona occludens toxin (predicted ATPase)
MADTQQPYTTHTHTHEDRREIRERTSGGNSGIAFVVGILVVVVAFLLWMFFGSVETTTTTGSAPADVNVTIQEDSAPAAPAPDAAAPAPEAAAPAGDAETAPATGE